MMKELERNEMRLLDECLVVDNDWKIMTWRVNTGNSDNEEFLSMLVHNELSMGVEVEGWLTDTEDLNKLIHRLTTTERLRSYPLCVQDTVTKSVLGLVSFTELNRLGNGKDTEETVKEFLSTVFDVLHKSLHWQSEMRVVE